MENAKINVEDVNMASNGIVLGYKFDRNANLSMINSTIDSVADITFGKEKEANGGYGKVNVTMDGSKINTLGAFTLGVGSTLTASGNASELYASTMTIEGNMNLGAYNTIELSVWNGGSISGNITGGSLCNGWNALAANGVDFIKRDLAFPNSVLTVGPADPKPADWDEYMAKCMLRKLPNVMNEISGTIMVMDKLMAKVRK
jgi:hypothetical protein